MSFEHGPHEHRDPTNALVSGSPLVMGLRATGCRILIFMCPLVPKKAEIVGSGRSVYQPGSIVCVLSINGLQYTSILE